MSKSSTSSSRGLAILVGGLAGLAVAGVSWLVVSKALDRQFANAGARLLTSGEAQLRTAMTRELQARIPQLVHDEITRTLNSYNITPETGRRIDRALRLADRAGII